MFCVLDITLSLSHSLLQDNIQCRAKRRKHMFIRAKQIYFRSFTFISQIPLNPSHYVIDGIRGIFGSYKEYYYDRFIFANKLIHNDNLASDMWSVCLYSDSQSYNNLLQCIFSISDMLNCSSLIHSKIHSSRHIVLCLKLYCDCLLDSSWRVG